MIGVCALVGTEMNAAAPDFSGVPPALVFILAGQSNMVGGNALSTLPAEFATPVPSIHYAYSLPDIYIPQERDWGPLEPLPPGVGATFAIELTFGRDVSAFTDLDVYLVKLADNGSGLSNQWRPDLGLLYDDLVAFVQTEVSAIEAEVIWGGFVWVQGTSDCFSASAGKAYEPNLVALSDALETDFGPMPFLQNQQSIVTGVAEGCPAVDGLNSVRAGKASFSTAPMAALIDTDDLSYRPGDCWHFDTPSTLELGHRLADAWIHQRLDIDADDHVGIGDFLAILEGWGSGGPDPNMDGSTGIDDFLAVLAHWG